MYINMFTITNSYNFSLVEVSRTRRKLVSSFVFKGCWIIAGLHQSELSPDGIILLFL